VEVVDCILLDLRMDHVAEEVDHRVEEEADRRDEEEVDHRVEEEVDHHIVAGLFHHTERHVVAQRHDHDHAVAPTGHA